MLKHNVLKRKVTGGKEYFTATSPYYVVVRLLFRLFADISQNTSVYVKNVSVDSI